MFRLMVINVLKYMRKLGELYTKVEFIYIITSSDSSSFIVRDDAWQMECLCAKA